MNGTPAGAIAVAQTCPAPGDVAANMEEHLRLAALAAGQGARIVAFPEMSLTGYEIELARDLAFTEDDARLAPLADLAATRAITLIAGAPVRLGSSLHIGAFILHADGSRSLYTKRRLGAFGESAKVDGRVPPAEATVFLPGDRDPLVRIGATLAAIAVCADIGDASHPLRAAARGARVYLASMFVIPSEFDHEAAKLCGYAKQHRMVVALANYGGASGALAAAGRSTFWSETGEIIVRLPERGSGVAVATQEDDVWSAGVTIVDGAIEGAVQR